MPFASLESSPLAPGVSPIGIYYRDEGEGPPLVLLHGGWGNSLHPFNRQIEEFRDHFRVICPDRSWYGRSNHPHQFTDFTTDFHYRAATETLLLLDSLGVERASFWGHSDGAVIAAIIGFTAPARVRALILEAFHYYRNKPASREFFEIIAHRPDEYGAELCERFAVEFGRDAWRKILKSHAIAWLQLAARTTEPGEDLYRGELHTITAPTLFLHGRLDPRTEPGEIDAVASEMPHAEMQILASAAHGPHSENGSADKASELAKEFLTRHLKAGEKT